MNQLFVTNRFFAIFFGIVAIYAISFRVEALYITADILLIGLFLLLIFDTLLLIVPKNEGFIKRILPVKFSNGDENVMKVELQSNYPFQVQIEVLHDLPVQFSILDFNQKLKLLKKESKSMSISLYPTIRGEYFFGYTYAFVSTKLGLIRKRHIDKNYTTVACHPSFVQLRKFDYLAISNRLQLYGTKKVREIEQTTEFANIREYQQGDDYKHINWRSTARNNRLMVNQFQAEKSQTIYCIIDKSRTMKMPFNELTLLDYAINSSLVLSQIAVRKQDKAGVMSFARVPDDFLRASNSQTTMQLISQKLYKLETSFLESDFGRLHKFLTLQVTQRSLLLLFTNFETMNAYKRQEKYIRALAKKHFLVVIFFENSEVKQLVVKEPRVLDDFYRHTVAEQMVEEKKAIMKEMKKVGIHTLYTKPENLTVDSINTYLRIRKTGVL